MFVLKLADRLRHQSTLVAILMCLIHASRQPNTSMATDTMDKRFAGADTWWKGGNRHRTDKHTTSTKQNNVTTYL
jgi:hypothetical protein